jgi:hypothetical protein
MLAAVDDPDGGGIVLAGPQGVGRTRLAHEAERRIAAAGHPTSWSAATRSTTAIDFGALAHLLSDDLAPLARQPTELLRRAADVIAGGAARGTGAPVLVVDDAHLLDDVAAAFLHQVAVRRLAALVVTLRSDERAPDAVTALWKDGLLARHDVVPLSRAATAGLLERVLDGHLDLLSLRRIQRTAAGNPLFLREIVHAALGDGSLARHGDLWRWNGVLAVSDRLVELVRSRIDAADPRSAPVLDLVAWGEPLPVWLAERLAGPESVDAAEHAGLVERTPPPDDLHGDEVPHDEALRFVHPVHREVLRATTTVGRRRAIADRLADALDEQSGHDEAIHLRDPHLAESGVETSSTFRSGTAAGSPARATGATGPGSTAPTGSTRATGPGGPTNGTRADGVGIGAAATGGRVSGTDPIVEASGGEVPATDAWVLLFDSRLAESIGIAQVVLARADATPQAHVWAATAATSALGLSGRTAEALAAADVGLGAARTHGPQRPWSTPEVVWSRVLALVAGGRLEEASSLVEPGGDPTRPAGTTHPPAVAGMWQGFQGLVARLGGDHATARSSLRDAVARLDEAGMDHFVRLWLAELAAALACSGDPRGGRKAFDEAVERDTGTNRVFEPWIALDGAWVCAGEGRLSEAVDVALRAADMALTLGQRAIEVSAAFDVARLGRPELVDDRLAGLVPLVEGRFAPACRDAARALVHRDPDRLADCTRRFEALGHELVAAEMGAVAEALLPPGTPDAAEAVHRARRLRSQCPEAVTPLLEPAPRQYLREMGTARGTWRIER